MLKTLLIVMLFCTVSPALARPTEVAYGNDARQNLDVYPSSVSCAGGCPVLIWVHGGGWRNGDKAMRNARNIAAAWTGAGVTVVSLNYRLTPDVMHPAHVQDVASGIVWTKQHIAAYGGNPSRLFLMGHSAGAHLVALVATDPQYLGSYGLSPARVLSGVFPIDGASYELNDRRKNERLVRNMIDNAFGTDPAVLTAASPINQVRAGQSYPSFILAVVKQRDEAVDQTNRLAGLLQRAGALAQVIVVDYPDERSILAAHGQIANDLGNLNHPMTNQLLQTVLGTP